MEIPRGTAIGFLENLQKYTLKEIYVVDKKKIEEEVSMKIPNPKPMSKEEKENF